MSLQTVPNKKPFDISRSNVLPEAIPCLEEKLLPRQTSTNACPVSVNTIKKNPEKLLMVKSESFEGVYSIAYRFGALDSGEEVIWPLGYYMSDPKPRYFNNYSKETRHFFQNFRSLDAGEKTRLMRAWIEEVAFVFFDADIVREKPRAFAIRGAPAWDQPCGGDEVKMWCCYHHGDSGNKAFVLRHWTFDANNGEFQGAARYSQEVVFVVDAKEEQLVKVPSATVLKTKGSKAAAALAAIGGSSEISCPSFPQLTRKYHSGFAHDRGYKTDFKGWFWKGSAVSDPQKISAEVLTSVGWNADNADQSKRKALAEAWAREVIHYEGSELYLEKPTAAYIPGLMEAAKLPDTPASADQKSLVSLSLWIVDKMDDGSADVSYQLLSFDQNGAIVQSRIIHLAKVDQAGFRLLHHSKFPMGGNFLFSL